MSGKVDQYVFSVSVVVARPFISKVVDGSWSVACIDTLEQLRSVARAYVFMRKDVGGCRRSFGTWLEKL